MKIFSTMLHLVCPLFVAHCAWGDALNFVAGKRLGHNHTPWIVKLISVDAQSGVAEFDFRVEGGWQHETIHISRILSLYFSTVPPISKNIQLRAAVKEDIGGDLLQPKKLYVSKEFHQRYPELLYVGAGRGLYVRGTVLSFQKDNEQFTINCLKNNGEFEKIEGVFDFMITGWVR